MNFVSLLQASPWLAYPLQVALSLLSAAVAGPGRWRTTACFAVASLSLPIPWLVPESMGVYRFFLVLTSLLAVLRAVDRARDRQPLSLAGRIWAITAPFETRRVTRAPPRLDLRRYGAALGYGALGVAGWWVALSLASQHEGAAHYALRWLGGALFCYAVIDSLLALIIASYRAAGFVLPPLHRAPVLARSLQELWGERWNLTVRDWFHRHCFMPLARKRRATLGVVASFGASVVIHVWIAFAVAGAEAAASMGVFFGLQGLLTVVERPIGALTFPPALGHAWTVACVLGTSPLFVEPILRAFER